MQRHLFLASASERRQDILRQFKIPFILVENLLKDEQFPPGKTSLRSAFRQLALQKALCSKKNLNGLILGVDTVVVFQNKIFGKPQTIRQAKSYLSCLSGYTHQVISAFGLYDTISGKSICRSDTTHITFKTIHKNEIDYYCQNFHVLDKAGAYGIQDYAKTFISKIKGSYYNVMGLPIEVLLRTLQNYQLV